MNIVEGGWLTGRRLALARLGVERIDTTRRVGQSADVSAHSRAMALCVLLGLKDLPRSRRVQHWFLPVSTSFFKKSGACGPMPDGDFAVDHQGAGAVPEADAPGRAFTDIHQYSPDSAKKIKIVVLAYGHQGAGEDGGSKMEDGQFAKRPMKT